jgi:predicted nucleotidyltransferase
MATQIGNWSRWLTDNLGIDVDDSDNEDLDIGNGSDERRGAAKAKSFQLLNELSDLLMLPKDMLLEKSIRKEVSVHA